ncbi:MAG TPA: prolipoprotein diacylglyceryl transferase family protein [Candidatus Limnocylindrales bacterium]
MPGTAVIAFEFDPFVRIAGTELRLETLVTGAGILVALLLAARIAGRTAADTAVGSTAGAPSGPGPLRRDDLLFIVLGIVPGAVLGARAGYGLLHVDYYSSHVGALLDPSSGSLEAGLGIVGGAISGAYVARLLEAPVQRWLDASALPLLVALGVGKIAQAFGGSGQGAPSDGPWATAYLGPGPWGSLAPALPAEPAQLYEAAATAVVALAILTLLASRRLAPGSGRVFLTTLGSWAVARAVVAATWRDEVVVAGLRAGQLLAAGIAIGCAIGLVLLARRRAHAAGAAADRTNLSWPDPEQPPLV